MKNLFVRKGYDGPNAFQEWHEKTGTNLWNVDEKHFATREELVDYCKKFEKSFGKPVVFTAVETGWDDTPSYAFIVLAYEICDEAREDEEWLQMLWDEDDRQFAH